MVYILDLKDSKGSFQYPDAEMIFDPNIRPIDENELHSDYLLTESQIENVPINYEVHLTGPDTKTKQHFLNGLSSVIISSQAKNILETIEPDKHQFIKVNVNYPEHLSTYYEDMAYFYLKTCQNIDAIDTEKSILKMDILGAGTGREQPSYRLDFNNVSKITIKSQLVKSKHIWRGVTFRLKHNLFLSDTLKEAWETLGETVLVIPCIDA